MNNMMNSNTISNTKKITSNKMTNMMTTYP